MPTIIVPGPAPTATPSPRLSLARSPSSVSICSRTRSAKIFCLVVCCLPPHPAVRGQVSLCGLAGILLALDEGLELNILGLNIGIDAAVPALKLPAIDRLGVQR